MDARSRIVALSFFLVGTELALGHGGTYRAPDGSRFGGDTCVPSRDRLIGGTTPRSASTTLRTQATGDPTHGWEWWWAHNGDAFLHARAAEFRAMATPRGATPGLRRDSGRLTALTKDQIRCGGLAFLRAGLWDSFFDARAAAAIAAGKVLDLDAPDAPEIIEAMRALLGDPALETREAACLGLGLLGDPSQVPDLLMILKNDPMVRRLAGAQGARIVAQQSAFAALALGLIGARSGLPASVVADMVEVVKNDPHQDVRVLTTIGLGVARALAAAPALRNLAANPAGDSIVRAHAIISLAKLSNTAFVEWLVRSGFTDPSTDVQRSTAIALGLLATREDGSTTDLLMRRARWANDRPVRNFSLMALGEIGGPAATWFLLRMAASGQPQDRVFAALALGVGGWRRADSRDEIGRELLRLWDGTRDDERGAFAIALGLLGHAPAIPVLTEALGSAKLPRLRAHLATGLGLLGARGAEPLLRDLARDARDWDAQCEVRKALGLIGSADSAGVLVEAIRSPVNDLSALGGAAVGLGFIGRKEPVLSLGDLLKKPEGHDDLARAFAAVALGCLGDKAEVPQLVAARSHCNYLATTEGLREMLRTF